MADSRFSLALRIGAIVLPAEGRIAVFRPRAGTDLTALPKHRVQVIQGFWPDHRAFVAAGYDCTVSAEGSYTAAVVFLPRAKAEARALLAEAVRLCGGGPVVVDGQKTDGVDSLYKDCRKRGASQSAPYAKAHGKLFTLSGGDFADWEAAANQTRLAGGFVTRPGVFSAKGIDRGSAALVAALPAKITGRVADLGAGWGYLSHHLLRHQKVSECHLVEAEHAALDCARHNITDPRAVFHWADATDPQLQGGFDMVVTNPPFHTGRVGEPALGQGFIAAAAALLKPSGTLWLVANRHLPYEAALAEAFREVSEVAGDPSFKIFRAVKPRRAAR